MTGTIEIAKDPGKGEIGDIKMLPRLAIGSLEAVFADVKQGKFVLVKGNLPKREMSKMVENGYGLEALGFFLRSGQNEERFGAGENSPYSFREVWKIIKKIDISARRALVTSGGCIRLLPMIKEKVRGVYYRLPGIKVAEVKFGDQELHLSEVLTSDFLIDAIAHRIAEDAGVSSYTPSNFSLYRTVRHYSDGISEHWNIMIPIPPDCWEEAEGIKVDVQYLDPDELVVFSNKKLIDAATLEMSLAAIWAVSANAGAKAKAEKLLGELKSEWNENFFSNGEEAIEKFGEQISLG